MKVDKLAAVTEELKGQNIMRRPEGVERKVDKC